MGSVVAAARREHVTTMEATLATAARDRDALDAKAKAFDADLQHDLEQAGGPKYAAIAMLAYRQTLAATAGGVIDTIRRPSRFMQRPATAGRFSFR